MISILFHAKSNSPFRPCMDGLFAAYAARLALPDAVLVPALNDPANAPALALEAGDQVTLSDISYPAFVLENWCKTGAAVTVIDHHKGNMLDLAGFSTAVQQVFDTHQSGAVLAWKQFFPEQPVPLLFEYVQDRDIWTKQLPDSDLASLGLAELMFGLSLDACLEHCHRLMALPQNLAIAELLDRGELAQTEIDAAVNKAVAAARWRIVAGYTVPFTICRTARQKQAYSDIGAALLKAHPAAPFVCVQTGNGWALRSKDGRLDVQQVAKTLGGNGHRNASGCKAQLPHWIARWGG